MRYAALLLVLVGCEDTPNEPIDAPLMIDASVDAAIDAQASCAKKSDCSDDCLLCCGMLGTCYTQCGSLTAQTSNSPCREVTCDPAIAACVRGDGSAGTCQAYQVFPTLMSPTYHRCQ